MEVAAAEVNFLHFCRLCANIQNPNQAMIDLFSTDGLKLNLLQKIKQHLPIDVSSEDGLPQQVCISCVSKLTVCDMLVSSCLEANTKLQALKAQAQAQDNLFINSVSIGTINDFSDDECENDMDESLGKTSILVDKLFNSTEIHEDESGLNVIITVPQTQLKETKKKQSSIMESTSSAEPQSSMALSQDGAPRTGPAATLVSMNHPASESWTFPDPPLGVSPFAVTVADKNNGDKHLSLYIVLIRAEADDATGAAVKKKLSTALSEFKSSSVSRAEAAITATAFACFACSLVFEEKGEMVSHFERSHSGEVWHCSECEETVCGSEDVFSRHCALHQQTTSGVESEFDLMNSMTSQLLAPVETFQQETPEFEVVALGIFVPERGIFGLAIKSANNVHESLLKLENSCMNLNQKSYDLKDIFNINLNGIYHCLACNKSCESNTLFKIHLMEIHTESEVRQCICGVCNKKFASLLSLKRHFHYQHTEFATTVCDECGKLIPTHKLLNHTRNHQYSLKRQECQYCHQILGRKAWNRHRKFNEGIDKNVLKKEKCGLRFANAKAYPDNLKLECESCHLQLSKLNWKFHYAYHEKFGPACPDNVPAPGAGRPKTAKERNRIKNRARIAELAWQKLAGVLHVGRIECPICHKMISIASKNEHMKSHNRDLRFECDFCRKNYFTKKVLFSHIKYCHLKLGPYSCTYCSKVFVKKRVVLSHEALHRGERNLKCPICPKMYSGQYNVDAHVKLVHNKPNTDSSNKRQRKPV